MLQLMKKTQLVGILNCTPDSFFEGGRVLETESAIQYGLRLLKKGQTLLILAENRPIPIRIPSQKMKRCNGSSPSLKEFAPLHPSNFH